MSNIFKQDHDHGSFTWSSLGDIEEGRGTLGVEMPVLVYRLMQFTMLDVLTKEYGREHANKLLHASGYLAGTEFALNALDLSLGFDLFIAQLQATLHEFKVGILRIESINEDASEIILTVGEDLDCSGLPITDEVICDYDEGFLSGILEAYTHKPYVVREVDCWANGDRICRFRCTSLK